MIKTKLAQSVAFAIAVGAVTSANAATTMYNTFTTTVSSATDGWTRIFDGTDADTIATGPESQGFQGTVVPWIGTGGGGLPFGYTGSSHLNWAIQLSGAGDSGEVSAADSTARYSAGGTSPDANYVSPAEIDTGGGAWRDNGLGSNGLPTASGPTGWKHQIDIGLIKSDTTAFITLKPTTLGAQSPTFSQFGVTVFTGMDTTTTAYSHHGAWNCPGCVSNSVPATPQPRDYTNSNPFYFGYANNTATTGSSSGTGVIYDGGIGVSVPGQAYSDNVDGVNGFTFLAQAGQVYSVYLGGVGFARWNSGVDNYKLEVSAAPVPIPAAVWLFGSALAGVGVIGRRKKVG